MKGFILRLWVPILLVIVFDNSSYAQSLPDSIQLRVVIIRHGEKPEKGLNLTCQGFNRSLELPKVIVSQFGVPNFTYVPLIKNGKSANAIRMFQTIVPLAVKYDLVINSVFDENDSTDIAADILKKKGTVLVVWNSHDIPSMVRSLGVKEKVLKWKEPDFDSIWIINYVKTAEGLKPVFSTSKENINPSPVCKYP